MPEEKNGAMPSILVTSKSWIDMAFTEQDLKGRTYILFDFDETLSHSKNSIVTTATNVLREWGMSDEEIGDAGRLLGPPFPEAYMQVYGMNRADAEEVTRRYREIYFKITPDTYPLFPGIREMLGRLVAQGYHLGIASSKLTVLVDMMLKGQNIREYFEVISGQTMENHVSKAVLVSRAMDEFGIEAKDCIMVGDLDHDINGGLENGVPAIGVYFGDTSAPGELEAAGAAACAHSVEELEQLLTK